MLPDESVVPLCLPVVKLLMKPEMPLFEEVVELDAAVTVAPDTGAPHSLRILNETTWDEPPPTHPAVMIAAISKTKKGKYFIIHPFHSIDDKDSLSRSDGGAPSCQKFFQTAITIATENHYGNIPLPVPAASQTTSPPAFGPCNVAKYDLIHSRHRLPGYSGRIPRFWELLPPGSGGWGKRGTTGLAAGSDVPEFPKGYFRRR